MNEPWSVPTLQQGGTEFISVDPRVVQDHSVNELPCPPNPPAPDGWRYWKRNEKVPPALGALASKMLRDAQRYPMGSFVQIWHDEALAAARVEWHDTKGATGEKGCFRGVNLMRPQEGAELPQPLG